MLSGPFPVIPRSIPRGNSPRAPLHLGERSAGPQAMPRGMDLRKRLAQAPESQTPGVLHPVGKAGRGEGGRAGSLKQGPLLRA